MTARPDALARHLRDAAIASAASRGLRPVLLIDGGAGAGKTSLAAAVAAVWPAAVVVPLDDIYPGWDGLEAASAAVVRDVLGAPAGYRRWDWGASRPGDWCEVPRDRPLIIEGCGSLSRASRVLAAYAVWLEVDAATRRRRALARDGERFAPHWERWARQEAAFRRRERPERLADEVLGGEVLGGDALRRGVLGGGDSAR